MVSGFIHIWQPFLLGCLLVGVVASIVSFLTVRGMWRYHIWTHLKIRRDREVNNKSH
ncbi:MAG: DUF2062 domain-containing protein [Proteobacteria bacterium]|nr:DUF2062 domain-containing protein [Pseudomonadota bacterium]